MAPDTRHNYHLGKAGLTSSHRRQQKAVCGSEDSHCVPTCIGYSRFGIHREAFWEAGILQTRWSELFTPGPQDVTPCNVSDRYKRIYDKIAQGVKHRTENVWGKSSVECCQTCQLELSRLISKRQANSNHLSFYTINMQFPFDFFLRRTLTGFYVTKVEYDLLEVSSPFSTHFRQEAEPIAVVFFKQQPGQQCSNRSLSKVFTSPFSHDLGSITEILAGRYAFKHFYFAMLIIDFIRG